jgi:hypothetical protein
MSAFGDEADIDRDVASPGSVVNDPERTLGIVRLVDTRSDSLATVPSGMLDNYPIGNLAGAAHGNDLRSTGYR